MRVNLVPMSYSVSRILAFSILIFLLIGCTKYAAKKNTTSTSTSSGTGSGSGATPLGAGGSSSGSGNSGSGSGAGSGSSGSGGSSSGSGSGSGTGSGSSGSGGSGSSGGGSSSGGGGSIGSGSSGSGGSGTGSNQIAQTYIQGLNYSSASNVVMWADSLNLLGGGYYTAINAGNVKVGAKYGNNETLTVGTYLLSPYSFYSLIIFDGSQTAGTILPNGTSTPSTNRAFIRFIDLDPTTKNANMICSAVSYADSSWFMNRRYIDHQSDTSLTQYKDVYATTNTITLKINNQIVKNFQYPFEQGKKYTIIALADPANGSSKCYIARHN